ncbi:aromatic acid exporter family protein [Jeotgalibacillus haloalkalitolerans]|uniref:Aromatic acid exporter family protein n=1 Tax=Jeotgalibacillus haloalkalitolerans TaxID=3104292 RepID=A0ABU5KN07_9BACL|nr:aromatic acid exporter family protein [Jeotgalibacillus sp. HH7-29]MDZ5712095.1 aromatic acid exporter family protein [Jeotgalibacillus sp. HH7-29]
MFRIGYRTIKTAAGTAAAIGIASMLGLENFASAGIITILCIQNTKRKSVKASWSRVLACLVAMVFSYVFFEGIAFNPLMIGLLILFFIPTAVALKIKEGIVTSSVIILHLYTSNEITLSLIGNELMLLTIGVITALFMNLYMPSVERKMAQMQNQLEQQFKEIFEQMSAYLRDTHIEWNDSLLKDTESLIKEGKTIAFQDVENHFLRNENIYYLYFTMREKQFVLIKRMLPLLRSLNSEVEQREMIAEFVEDLSTHIHPGNTAALYLKKLYDMKLVIENMPMPKEREEFETRAALFQFIREMEEYLQIKQSFRGIPLSRRQAVS